MYALLPSRANGLNFNTSLNLFPYFEYENREGSGELEHLCRLVSAYVARQWDMGFFGICVSRQRM